ncbi:MAG: type II CAAX endopeptidase family protein [Planctomycetota bacterium]
MPYAPYVLGTGLSLAGLLMTLILYGLPGVRRLAFQLIPWSVGRAWPVLAVCLLLPLGVVVLAVMILAALGTPVSPLLWREWLPYPYCAVIGEGLIGAGLIEEIGWRGFALPHLQRRCSALVSSLIIGVVWGFWHLPNFVLLSPIEWGLVAACVANLTAMSVVFTWAYNTTGGSLFAIVLLHGAVVASRDLFASLDSGGLLREGMIEGLLYAVIAVGLVWRYGAANLSPRYRLVAQPPDTRLHQPVRFASRR